MENQELEKLYMNQMTLQKMYKLFGLRKVTKIKELEDWLAISIKLTDEEIMVTKIYQDRLIRNLEVWNEHDLSMGFIGPILNLINFTIPYRLNLFAQRTLEEIVASETKQYKMIGKPDGILANGYQEPEIPYFSFQEYKRDINSSGDPAGQNLAAMLVGQTLNEDKSIIYGSYVVGRNWYFMVLKGKEFAISKAYVTDDDEIFEIIKILKALRNILFGKLGIKE